MYKKFKAKNQIKQISTFKKNEIIYLNFIINNYIKTIIIKFYFVI